MTWEPDPNSDVPQRHPDYPEVQFISYGYIERVSANRGFQLCEHCPLKETCFDHICEGGYFITTTSLVQLRLLGTL